jgi:hypothetical protein
LEGLVLKGNDGLGKEGKRVKYEIMVGLVIIKVLKAVFVKDEQDAEGEMGEDRIMEES